VNFADVFSGRRISTTYSSEGSGPDRTKFHDNINHARIIRTSNREGELGRNFNLYFAIIDSLSAILVSNLAGFVKPFRNSTPNFKAIGQRTAEFLMIQHFPPFSRVRISKIYFA